MRHLPFVVSIALGAAVVFVGYVVRFPVYFAWLIGVCGSLCAFVGAFAWLILCAPGERKGLLFLVAGVLTAVGYLPLHTALSEALKSADSHVRVNGNMEFALFIIPALVAGLSIFHGVRLLAEKKPNAERSAAP